MHPLPSRVFFQRTRDAMNEGHGGRFVGNDTSAIANTGGGLYHDFVAPT